MPIVAVDDVCDRIDATEPQPAGVCRRAVTSWPPARRGRRVATRWPDPATRPPLFGIPGLRHGSRRRTGDTCRLRRRARGWPAAGDPRRPAAGGRRPRAGKTVDRASSQRGRGRSRNPYASPDARGSAAVRQPRRCGSAMLATGPADDRVEWSGRASVLRESSVGRPRTVAIPIDGVSRHRRAVDDGCHLPADVDGASHSGLRRSAAAGTSDAMPAGRPRRRGVQTGTSSLDLADQPRGTQWAIR